MRKLLCLLLVVLTLPGVAQEKYPKGYFRSPVNFPITLAGSFGELRRNHFHSGIDIRTGGVQGKPVYAVADGYVSRINVSPAGFGKALYITHPNGYLSLYAHLKSYAGPVAAWVREHQYKNESFAFDTEVPQGVLRVKKGDLIAYSGNSGSSGGPHVHFEIRDARSQEIIDPLDFGFMKPDGIPPRIAWLKIYPMDGMSMVNFVNRPLQLAVQGSGGGCYIKPADTVKVSGRIVFGIEPSDHADGGLKTGVHTIRLQVDGNVIFSQSMDRFSFSETRYVNSLMDYPAFVQSKRKIQRSYVAPGNRLSIYRDVVNRGVYNFTDNRAHHIQYEVKDVFGNTARLSFWVKSHPPAGGRPRTPFTGDQLLLCGEVNRFERPGIRLELPETALYEDLPFEYAVSAPAGGSYAEIHQLHNNLTPLHTFCTLSIKTTGLPATLTDKAVVVQLHPGNRRTSIGGKFSGGYMTAQIREFGKFTVMTDMVAPVIRPVNVFNNKKVTRQTSILVKISDNLSGIKTYRGTLNGKWILMDYDAKNNLLSYSFDDRMKSGRNTFVLTVTDGVGNSTTYQAVLIK